MGQEVTAYHANDQAYGEYFSSGDGPADPGMKDGYLEDWIYDLDDPSHAEMIHGASIVH